jgi:plastocyanin
MNVTSHRAPRPVLRAALAAVTSAAIVAATVGCGSSSTTTTTTVSPAKTSSTASSTPSAQLHVQTTPKFAVPSSSSPVLSGVVPITYHNISIAPDTIRVKVGSTIKWTNEDNVQHNVTSVNGPQHFASKNFGEGGTFEIKANKPGTIHYECTIHPATMNGTIEVVS